MRNVGKLARLLSLAAVTAVIGTGLAADRAPAQETINLTATDGYPPRAVWVREFIEFYIPEVDRRLAEKGNYRINWTQAWSGQIAKPTGVLQAMEQGLADIAIITVPFFPDRLPLNVITYSLPFTSSDPALMARVMDDLMDEFPEFRQQFEDANQVVLTNYSTIDSYQLFTSRPIEQPSDLQGARINAAGDNMRYLDAIGAVGVRGALTDYYNNIRTGVVEGAVMWIEGAATFNLQEVAPYFVDVDFGTAVNKSLTVNKSTWDGLPEEVQEVLQEVAIELRDRHAELAVADAEAARKAFLDGGGQLIEVSEEERQQWAQALEPLGREWAEAAEAEGLPGKAYLSAFMEGMRTGGAAPLRDWDKD
jgi:C4-dicarboxylate-binding protein DctP